MSVLGADAWRCDEVVRVVVDNAVVMKIIVQ